MVLLAGLRDCSVGDDTLGYAIHYEQTPTICDTWEASQESGYLILRIIAHSISHDYWAILTVTAVVAVSCYMVAIYKFSLNPAMSLFVLISMGYYTFIFNGARQGLACAIYALAFGSLIDGMFLRYVLYVGIAFLFHKSAIIALPLYIVFRQESSLKYVVLTSVVAAIIVLFFPVLFQVAAIVNPRYSIYQELETRGGELLTVFYALLSIFFFLFRHAISTEDRPAYDCFLNMLIVGATVYIAVRLVDGYVELMRVAAYFQIASVFLWPIAFRSMEHIWERGTRLAIGFVFAAGHLAFFYIFLLKIGKLTPYQLNGEVIRWFTHLV